jgi:hypothetical protein
MMKRLGVLVYVVMASAALARAEEGKAAALASLQGMAGVTAAAESTKSLPGVAVAEAAATMPTIYTDYTGNSRHIGLRGFNVLERLGVQGEAEDRAMANCQAVMRFNCVIIGSQVTSCNRFKCEATASAGEQDIVRGARYEMVIGSFFQLSTYHDDYNDAGFFSPLERIGVVKSARDKALFICKEKGLQDCVIATSSMVACVDGYKCEATAIARGRK